MELAERKKKILSAVIESYINTGEPIGSKALINETGLEVSSATVRNDLADLTIKATWFSRTPRQDEFQRCRATDTTSTI